MNSTEYPGEYAARLRGRHILLAEDCREMRELLGHILRSAGARVYAAENGIEAIEASRAQDYDLMILDIQMPVLDGRETARRLRSLGYKNPLLALSAQVFADEEEQSRAAGFDRHLAKPIGVRDLLTTIVAVLS